MSNYNTQLQSNNINLQTVLQTLQTKAAGGSETPTNVTLNFSWTATSLAYAPEVLYSYINENGDYISGVYVAQKTTSGSTTLTVAKNSMICILPQFIDSMTGVTSYSSSDGIINLIDYNVVNKRYRNAFHLIKNNGNLTVTIHQVTVHGGGSN